MVAGHDKLGKNIRSGNIAQVETFNGMFATAVGGGATVTVGECVDRSIDAGSAGERPAVE